MLQGNWCQQYPDALGGRPGLRRRRLPLRERRRRRELQLRGLGPGRQPGQSLRRSARRCRRPQQRPDAEGGALRSQDILTPAPRDPTSLDGALLRLDVSAQPPTAPAGNPLVGNGVADDDFIVAIGLRNPFRINKRPGTERDLDHRRRLEHVGGDQSGPGSRAAPSRTSAGPATRASNAGSAKQPGYQNRTLCARLYGELGAADPGRHRQRAARTTPTHHAAQVVPGELCGTGSSSVDRHRSSTRAATSRPSTTTRSSSPTPRASASGRCSPTPSGLPDKTHIAPLVSQASGRVVDIQMGADGRLYYVDFDNGRIYRVEYFVANEPPTAGDRRLADQRHRAAARCTSTARTRATPRTAPTCSTPGISTATAQFDDSTLAAPSPSPTRRPADTSRACASRTPTAAATSRRADHGRQHAARRRDHGARRRRFQWSVGESIDYALEATDLQDGLLPAVAARARRSCCTTATTPTNCHTHPITTVERRGHGSFLAPDHEYPVVSRAAAHRDATCRPPTGSTPPGSARRKLTLRQLRADAERSPTSRCWSRSIPRASTTRARSPGRGSALRRRRGNAAALRDRGVESGRRLARLGARARRSPRARPSDYICLYYDNPAARTRRTRAARLEQRLRRRVAPGRRPARLDRERQRRHEPRHAPTCRDGSATRGSSARTTGSTWAPTRASRSPGSSRSRPGCDRRRRHRGPPRVLSKKNDLDDGRRATTSSRSRLATS